MADQSTINVIENVNENFSENVTDNIPATSTTTRMTSTTTTPLPVLSQGERDTKNFFVSASVNKNILKKKMFYSVVFMSINDFCLKTD